MRNHLMILAALSLVGCSQSVSSDTATRTDLPSALSVAYRQCISEVLGSSVEPSKLEEAGLKEISSKRYSGFVNARTSEADKPKAVKMDVDFAVGREPWMIRGCYVLIPKGTAYNFQFIEALWDYAQSNGYRLSFDKGRFYLAKGSHLIRFHFQSSLSMNSTMRAAISYPSGFDPSNNVPITKRPANSDVVKFRERMLPHS